MMDWLELKIPPPLLFAGTALVMWVCSHFLPFGNIIIPGQTIISVLLFVCSCIIGWLSFFTFIKQRANLHPVQLERTSVLVTKGIYRLSRNPMYLSLAGLLFCWGTQLSNLFVLCCPLLFIFYMTRFQIQPEEKILAARFPKKFHIYKCSVRRWI